MTNMIGIAFLDKDRFFADGCCQVLDEYFRQRGVQVNFTQGMDADLIFKAVAKGDMACFCHPPNSPCGLYVSIRDDRDKHTAPSFACLREAGKIYRNESRQALIETVDGVMRARNGLVRRNSCCSWCKPLKLTQQEKAVMRYLSWEMTPTAIARRLNVSLKTVSTHKRAVMKKMNFHRDAELYRWLRGEGLTQRSITA
ncbi:two component system sensor kinase SsrB [Serratia entomophila]|uniref:response regulator transcription factor n=1 Tax=Serratia entomophila TaxID=42906 RepID=UPI001F2DEF8A|nr:helix-turn-helix transcriptional regulator [Serratia entomophila]UIW19706.1 helix-turn-helix transcriptional regulator [Serratia entomophila]CAI0712642.1 two component system sensor kinase SsrB [Serratia entomophila]CAI0780450.1 two component system sensor kinase SsrB [Serratia entomophila]CAI0780629.1 two component system sensor kinase SsrB [Serratia entomophila]CAI0780877.1 two component system sensor kinase SsrB [Serratia entomophila]